jgi:PAS domain S-box-containing protein
MRVPRDLRDSVLPLVVWALLVIVGSGVLLWQQHESREVVTGRFDTGVRALGTIMTSVAAEQLVRERAQGRSWLSGPDVTARDFDIVVSSFDYTSAVLLDARGRVMENFPSALSLIGQDVAVRYEHLRSALRGTPTVSVVVPNAARGEPVVAFAVPFETSGGRRVFSGAIPIRASPLAPYLTSALSISGSRVSVVDTAGNIVAATDTFDSAQPTLAGEDGPLAVALADRPEGRYRAGGHDWRYASVAINGTPWKITATVRESELYSSLVHNELAGRAALAGAAVIGLVVVLAVGRARASRRELAQTERRFRKLFDGSRIGMVVADVEGHILWVNPAACDIVGRAAPDVLGRRIAEFAHPDDAHRLDGHEEEAAREMRYVRATGEIVEAAITGVVLRDDEDRPQYVATQLINTTERRALERERERIQAELARHAEELQDANTHLADVMAMLSHDVRQPLAKIVGLGGLLQEEWAAIPEHTKVNYLQRMTAAGHRANDLVTDILMLAQLDAGAMPARPVRIDISRVARDAVAAFHVSSGTPVSVIAPNETTGLADPAQLQLVLGNLLTNAGKYGLPPIEVTVVNAGEQVKIQVADEGEGVPADFVPRLFDRFARADTGVATTAPGTGLGLYLVRQLAKAGGLDVSYEPNLPHGSIFTVTIPRTAPAPITPPMPRQSLVV